ncbi:MAG: type II toxin-antitoxin system VapB family antitoxin [Microvirga sp.]
MRGPPGTAYRGCSRGPSQHPSPITHPNADRLMRTLAAASGTRHTEAVKLAIETRRIRKSLRERLRPLIERAQQAIRDNPDPIGDWKASYDSLEGADVHDPIARPTLPGKGAMRPTTRSHSGCRQARSGRRQASCH